VKEIKAHKDEARMQFFGRVVEKEKLISKYCNERVKKIYFFQNKVAAAAAVAVVVVVKE
jgi:hypothetical protein